MIPIVPWYTEKELLLLYSDMLAILFTFMPLGERITLKIIAAVLYSSDSLDVLGELKDIKWWKHVPPDPIQFTSL